MAFKKKTWKDRLVEYAGRKKITNVSTLAAQIVDMERAEGIVSEEGSAFSAANMNDFEQRVADGFSGVEQEIKGINSNLQWKFLGQSAGTTPLSLPSTFYVMYIEVNGIYDNIDYGTIIFTMPRCALSTSAKMYAAGYAHNPESEGTDAILRVRLSISTSNVSLLQYGNKYTNIMPYTTVKIWYR